MMDNRRLDTAGVILAGVLSLPAPSTEIPTDREVVGPTDLEAVRVAIESGKLVEVSNYYGIPSAWKQADGIFRGVLMQYRMQYRAVTGDRTFATAGELAEWFVEKYHATDG